MIKHVHVKLFGKIGAAGDLQHLRRNSPFPAGISVQRDRAGACAFAELEVTAAAVAHFTIEHHGQLSIGLAHLQPPACVGGLGPDELNG